MSPRVAKAREVTAAVVPSPPPMTLGGNLPPNFVPPGSMDDSDDDSMTGVIVAEHHTKEAAGEHMVGLPGMTSALGYEPGMAGMRSRTGQGYGGGASENTVNGSTAHQLKMMRGAQGLRQAPQAPGGSTQLTQQPLMSSQQPLRVAPITTLTLDL